MLARRTAEHVSGFVECLLLFVAPHLSVIETPLADVPIALLTVDPGLAVIKDAVVADGSACVAAALVIVADCS